MPYYRTVSPLPEGLSHLIVSEDFVRFLDLKRCQRQIRRPLYLGSRHELPLFPGGVPVVRRIQDLGIERKLYLSFLCIQFLSCIM